MQKFNFSRIISKKTYINELNSRILTYRINGIINCCASLMDPNYLKRINAFSDIFGKIVFTTNNGEELTIFAYKTYDENHGDCINLEGITNGLKFSFNNYLGINEIPFNLKLVKMFNDAKYEIEIESDIENKIQFDLAKNDIEKLHFYTIINDFSSIIDVTESFIIDPDMVFDIYDEILENGPVKSLKMYK